MAPDEFDDADESPDAEDTPSSALPRAMAAIDFDPADEAAAPRAHTSHAARRMRREAARNRRTSLPAATPIGSLGQPLTGRDTTAPGSDTAAPEAPSSPGPGASDARQGATTDTHASTETPPGTLMFDSPGDNPFAASESLAGWDTPSETEDAESGIEASRVAFETPTSEFETTETDDFAAFHAAVLPAATPARTARALEWADPVTVATAGADPRFDAAPFVPVTGASLVTPRRRSGAAIAAPIITALVLAVAYVAATLLWPLDAVAPTVQETTIEPVSAPDIAMPWPDTGSAAVGVEGINSVPSSDTAPGSMASITKLVTSLMVLDERPLELGEQGPQYAFTAADSQEYWAYRSNGESALDVPVDGTLSEYQLLEGTLVASANNYADRLATEIWGSDQNFAAAAAEWLDAHELSEITVVDPAGIDPANTATPAALVRLGELAMANPVIAQIVAEPSVDAPGEDEPRENSNGLLGEEGIVGLKTGTLLNWWNLLAAKDVTVGDSTVRLYAAVVGQPDDDARLAVARNLFGELEQSLTPFPSVTTGTVVATVTTEWGASSEVAISDDASVVLWNGQSADVETDLELGDARDAGESVGSVAVSGPLDEAEAALELTGDVDPPSPWWRITHPLDLLGLN